MEEVDAAIMAAVARGDWDRAAVLIDRHISPAVWSCAYALLARSRSAIAAKDDADDLTQDTAIKLIEALQARRFEGRGTLLSYAIQIARRKVYHRARWFWIKWVLRLFEPGVDADAPVPSDRAPPWGEGDVPTVVRAMLEHLDERERTLISLRLEGMDTPTIARSLGISEANVYQVHSRGIAKLRAIFVRDEDGTLVLAIEKLEAKPPGRRKRKS